MNANIAPGADRNIYIRVKSYVFKKYIEACRKNKPLAIAFWGRFYAAFVAKNAG